MLFRDIIKLVFRKINDYNILYPSHTVTIIIHKKMSG